MQSKTSCFNRAVFRKTLSRCWPLWAGAAIILFFSLPFVLAGYERIVTFGVSFDAVVIDAAFNAVNSLPLFTCLFGLCFAAGTFSFLFSRRGTGLMASLPLKREGLFLSSFAAGLTMLLSAGLLTTALAAILTLTKGVNDLSAVWTWLGAYAMESVTFYAIGVFCAMLTGQALVLIPLYALVNFGGVLLSGMLQFMARMLLVGVPAGKTLGVFSWLETLSPCEQLLVRAGTDYSVPAPGAPTVATFSGWPVVLIYFAAGIALTVLSLVLFRRRKMEYAQEPATGKALGQVLKYIVTFYCALGFPAFVWLFFNDNFTVSTPGLLIFTALGAVIGYLISEMILHKSVRVLRSSWKGLLVTAAVACLVVGAMKLDVFGYVRNVPDADAVESADLEAWYSLKAEVTDPDAVRMLTELHRDLIDEHSPSVYAGNDLVITYHLKNGKTLTRAYNLRDSSAPDSSGMRLREVLSRSEVSDTHLNARSDVTPQSLKSAEIEWTEQGPDDPDDTDYYTGQYVARQLTKADALDLYQNGILPDLEAGAFPYTTFDDAMWFPSEPTVDFVLEWEDGNQQLLYHLNADCTNTLAWLAQHGYESPGIE